MRMSWILPTKRIQSRIGDDARNDDVKLAIDRKRQAAILECGGHPGKIVVENGDMLRACQAGPFLGDGAFDHWPCPQQFERAFEILGGASAAGAGRAVT